MRPERRQRVREVFATVADLSPEDRERALQESCGDDEQLRSAVQSLLDHHDSLGDALPPGADVPLLAEGDLVADRFRVRRMVGAGGMGEVYECEDVTLEQPVALKALRPSAAGSDSAERFKREIQIARSVTHPNVCRVYEYGQHATGSASIDFLIMEYVDGETLKDYLDREGPLTPEQARPLVQQIAAGLEALHDSGVVHRDLKPGNVLLDRRRGGRPRVVLTDFGIAGPIGERKVFGAFATVSGQVLGTPQYMAPEQLTGLAAGPATDLFALGIVYYEMLTGERPFPDNSRRTDPPAPPSVRNPDVPPELDRLILDCLQTDLSKRPNTVDAVFEVLGSPTKATDASRAKTVAMRVTPQPAARRKVGRLAALVLAALAVGGLGSRLFVQSPAVKEGRRVAVLPFVPAGGGADLQALADGLTDTVTGRLSQYESLNEELLVVPAVEVRRVGVATADAAHGGLGVNYAIQGHLSAQDDRIRLTLTLIDTKRMVQQETAVVNGLRSKALDLEDEAVTQLATLLDLQALPSQVGSVASVAPGAQEFYLQGRGYIQRSDELDSVDNAIQLYEKAIALDPKYARAYAGLSDAYLYKRDRTQDPEWITKAAEASRRAVELSPNLMEAQIARGHALLAQGEVQQALEFFHAVLERNPRSSEAYAGVGKAYSDLANQSADPETKSRQRKSAEAAYRKAISLRPNDWVAYKRLGLFYADVGRFEESIEQYEIVADLAPDNAHAFSNLAVFHHMLDNDAEARRYLERTLEIDPKRVSAMGNLAMLLKSQKDYKGAAEWLERAIQINENDYAAWGNVAGCYRAMGRHEDADSAFRKAILLVQRKMEIEGESPTIHSLLAHHYAGLRDFGASRKHALQVLDSENSQDQVNIAVAFNLAGDKEAARKAVRRALELGYPEKSLTKIEALEDILE